MAGCGQNTFHLIPWNNSDSAYQQGRPDENVLGLVIFILWVVNWILHLLCQP